MNLSFRTHFPWKDGNGQPVPTHFVQRINNELDPTVERPFPVPGRKLHTLRRIKDGRRRFRAGMKLVMTTGSRFKPVPFAVAECVRTQTVSMNWQWIPGYGYGLVVDIEGKACSVQDIKELARNDGFWSEADFYRWFLLDLLENGDGLYELIHWTKMRY